MKRWEPLSLPCLLVALSVAACSSVPQPSTEPPPIAAEAAPPTSAALPAETVEEATPEPPGTSAAEDDDPTLVQLGRPAETQRAPLTLVEAARRAREQRRRSEKEPIATITNENLAEFAAKGQVTFAPEPANAAAAGADGDDSSTGGDEAYWRSTVRRLRLNWAEAVERAKELEDEVADLRWQFYAADDPFLRDERIKPQWDRAIDDLRAARVDSERFREDLAETLEAGRQAGALPGWLRDGIELEPEVDDSPEDREPEAQQPIPPPIYNQPPG
ncbi:MAG: hypothetical protein AAF604_13575 [Acidobacteriota bacterium]